MAEHRGRSRAREVVPVRKRRSTSLPARTNYDNVPLQPNWGKIQQVLSYSRSLDKLSDLTGEDVETLQDIQAEQLEREMKIGRTIAIPPSKKTSQKALNILGHDPSAEKVKKTMGLDEAELERVRTENLEMEENRLQKKRAIDTPYDKRSSAKALATLGFDPSAYRSMKLLGLSEDNLKLALMSESLRLEQQIAKSRKNLASRNRKENKKALTVVGHDPSKAKIVNQLGEESFQEVNSLVTV